MRAWITENSEALIEVDRWCKSCKPVLIPRLTHCWLLVVAGNIVPLDSIGIEVVQDSEANLRVRRVFSCCSVVRLWQISPSCVGPVGALTESDRLCVPVVPRNHFVCVVHNSSRPEVALRILSNQSVEVVLLGRAVEGDRLHAHRLAVSLGLVLLECGAANLPSSHVPSLNVVPWIRPKVVWSCCSAQTCPSYKPWRSCWSCCGSWVECGGSWLLLLLLELLPWRLGLELLLLLLELLLGLGLELLLRLLLELLLLESRRLLRPWSLSLAWWWPRALVVPSKEVVESIANAREEAAALGKSRSAAQERQK